MPGPASQREVVCAGGVFGASRRLSLEPRELSLPEGATWFERSCVGQQFNPIVRGLAVNVASVSLECFATRRRAHRLAPEGASLSPPFLTSSVPTNKPSCLPFRPSASTSSSIVRPVSPGSGLIPGSALGADSGYSLWERIRETLEPDTAQRGPQVIEPQSFEPFKMSERLQGGYVQ